MPSGRLEALLADLGPGLHRGSALPSSRTGRPVARLASGLPAIDALIGGGLPADRLSEISGPLSSGRTSLALALLARATGVAREFAAVVDPADAFDPASAEAAGADLDRILWARPSGWRETLRAAERLLETAGIPLVILDASGPGAVPSATPASSWTRLARLCAGTRSALVVLSDRRLTGAQAELVLELRPAPPRFSGSPPLLEGIALHAVLARRRHGADAAGPVD